MRLSCPSPIFFHVLPFNRAEKTCRGAACSGEASQEKTFIVPPRLLSQSRPTFSFHSEKHRLTFQPGPVVHGNVNPVSVRSRKFSSTGNGAFSSAQLCGSGVRKRLRSVRGEANSATAG